MSDLQLAEFFKKPSTGSVCGRFMHGQLDREIEIPRKSIRWIKYFFSILLPALFTSRAVAQGIVAKKIKDDELKPISQTTFGDTTIVHKCSFPTVIDNSNMVI